MNPAFPTIILFSIAVSLGMQGSFVSKTDSKTLDWNENRKLEWADFQGSPDLVSNHAALTTYQIGFTYIFEDEGEIKFVVRCQFIKDNSWVKRHAKTNYILNHEQKHFDLAEVYARILRKKLDQYDFKGKKLRDVDKVIDRLYDEVWYALDAAQKDYDKSCNHGIDEEEQAKWDVKIEALLQDTRDFKSTWVTVPF